ncbi:acyl-CoA thioesterase [Pacificimonas flava]|uniref:acyl-CoA thioesterase n=1 Tax=Pacificimonas flava TaxID=1234595 RepID=UPI000570C2E7|nr:acyl-CoA thioesterase [Pacificimonas flava]MBB5280165.1 acyl-CoA thioester hydrolase [Pacificimonas flava]
MKNDPARQRRETYAYAVELAVRYGDLDTNNHLNNVAFSRFFEEGRVRLHHSLGGRRELDFRPIVANISIDYLREGGWPAPIEVCAGIVRFGTSSYVVGQALFQEGACIAVSDTVMVNRAVDGPGGAPLPESLRTALEPFRLSASPTESG